MKKLTIKPIPEKVNVKRYNFDLQEKVVLKKSAIILNKFMKGLKSENININFRDRDDNDFIYDISQLGEIADFLTSLSNENFSIE